jgi:hypothetical protein
VIYEVLSKNGFNVNLNVWANTSKYFLKSSSPSKGEKFFEKYTLPLG